MSPQTDKHVKLIKVIYDILYNKPNKTYMAISSENTYLFIYLNTNSFALHKFIIIS